MALLSSSAIHLLRHLVRAGAPVPLSFEQLHAYAELRGGGLAADDAPPPLPGRRSYGERQRDRRLARSGRTAAPKPVLYRATDRGQRRLERIDGAGAQRWTVTRRERDGDLLVERPGRPGPLAIIRPEEPRGPEQWAAAEKLARALAAAAMAV